MNRYDVHREGVRHPFLHLTGGREAALVRFDFRFENGDHQLANLAVGAFTFGSGGAREPDSYLLSFSDQDLGLLGNEEGDPATLSASYLDLTGLDDGFGLSGPHLVRGERRGTGLISLPISPLEDDEVVLLRGFHLSIPSGASNHHIRALGVRFDPDRQAWQVTFRDDSPEDDTFSAYVAYYRARRRYAEGTDRVFSFSPIRSLTQAFRGTARIDKAGVQGYTLLAGFHFEYLDSDHHLRDLGVDLRDIHHVFMTFRDNDTPPVRGTVDTVELTGYQD